MSPVDILFFLVPTLVVVLVAATCVVSFSSKRWLKTKEQNLPPGSMGWPVIGETLSFISCQPCTSLGPYMEERIHKHGKIFKSHLLGMPTIVSADPDLNDFILRNDGKLFEANWPKSILLLFGKTSVLTTTGEMHRYLKSHSVNFLNITRQRDQIFRDANDLILGALSTWKENFPFSLKEEASTMTFNLFAKNILGLISEDQKTHKLHKLYTTLMKGLLAIPLNIPGTQYNKSWQSRGGIVKVITELMDERVHQKKEGADTIGQKDFLGFVLEHSELNAEEICDLLMGLLFAGHETTTTAILMAVYFLQDCPKAVEQLREEHRKMLSHKSQFGDHANLTFEDFKHMEFTNSVVREILRLGNIARMVYRKAITDVRFKGFDIPRGWSVIPVLSAGHLDPSVYENPHKFDPWRCQKDANKTIRTDNYIPFGRGMHTCAGADVAKMMMVVFLHHFILNYNWEPVEPDQPIAFTFPNFPKGLPMKVRRTQFRREKQAEKKSIV